VLVLRDIEQLDYAQISQTLDIPIGTVKSRLFRARLALRQEVDRLCTVGGNTERDAGVGGYTQRSAGGEA